MESLTWNLVCMKLFQKIILVFFVSLFGYIPLVTHAALLDYLPNTSDSNQIKKANEIQQIAGKPTHQIKIPGLTYSDIAQSNENGEIYLYIPFLGQYLATVYRYLVIAAGVIAVIVIIVAGIQWTASGGNSSTIESAKNKIIGAITGLCLAVGSYIILYTINPDLVAFRSLKIQYLVGQNIEGDHGETTDYTGVTVTANDIASANCPEVKKNLARTLPLRGSAAREDPPSQYYKAAEACRKKCLETLPDEKRSKSSGSGVDTYLGYVDCSANHGTRSLSSITEIGIHEGRAPQGVNWWWITALGGNAGFGSHYTIARDGTIAQIEDERFVVYHGVDNKISIGIDLDAGASSGSSCTKDTCTYTQAQYDAINKLITDIQTRTKVKFDDDHIKGHCQVGSGGNDHVDPRYFDWSKIGPENARLDPEKHKDGVCKYTL